MKPLLGRFLPATMPMLLALVLGLAVSTASGDTSTSGSTNQNDHSAHHQNQPGNDEVPVPAPAPSGSMPMQSPSTDGTQDSSGMMSGDMGQMMQMMSMMRQMMNMMSAESGMMTPNVEGRIAALKTELKISASQENDWNHFADSLREIGKSMNGMYQFGVAGATNPQKTDLLSRLKLHQKMLAAHADALAKVQKALEPLYASFSDDQKKVADRLMIGPMGMM